MARFRQKLAARYTESDLINAHSVLDEWMGDAQGDDNPEAVRAFKIAMQLIDEKLEYLRGVG
jgi:hypothetical protein